MGLKTRLTAITLTLTFLSAALIAGVLTWRDAAAVKERIRIANESTTVQLADGIQRVLQAAMALVETLSESDGLAAMDGEKVKQILLTVQKHHPHFELLFVMDEKGDQIARTSGKLTNRKDREYFKRALAGEVFVSQPYISVFTDKPAITVSAPIRRNGQIVGVFAADISLKKLSEFASLVEIGRSGYIDIVDQAKRLIYSPDETKILKDDSVQGLPYIQAVANGERGSVEATATNGEDALITFTPIPLMGWGVIAYQPLEELAQDEHASLLAAVGVLGAVLLLTLIIVLFTMQRIVRPLEFISRVLNKIARYDLAMTDERRLLDTYRSDHSEIGVMSRAIADTWDNLLALIQKVADGSKTTAATAEELTSATRHAAQAALQVKDDITSITEHMAERVEDTREIVDAIGSAESHLQTNFAILSKLLSTTEDIERKQAESSGILQGLMKSAGESRDVASGINSVIQETKDSTEKIFKASAMIQAIADQTNLLALNAAIEAARAGAAVRGFAVVAEEIRKLAEQSAGFTDEIETVVHELMNKVGQAVASMSALRRIVDEQDGSVKGTLALFDGIAANIENSKIIGDQLKESAQKVQENNAAIASRIAALRASAEQNAATAHDALTAVDEQGENIRGISAGSENLAAIAGDLNREVARFHM